MRLTARQSFLLANLAHVQARVKRGGRKGFSLDGKDCSDTIISLIVKGEIKQHPATQRLTRTCEILPIPQ